MTYRPIQVALQVLVQVLGRGQVAPPAAISQAAMRIIRNQRQMGLAAATNRVKARQSRDYYFVRKLRVEFAAMELVERRTGMAFSRHDVPRYLDELRAELAKMQGSAGAPVQSLAHDVQHIDTELNKHIDKLLAMIGTPTNVAPKLCLWFLYAESTLAENPRCGRGKNGVNIAEI